VASLGESASGTERRLAIACAAGGFKGAFVHGVLSAFEEAGLRADAYGASSASVASTAFAAVGIAREVGVAYWLHARGVLDQPGHGMSQVVLECVRRYAPLVRAPLFAPETPRLVITASEVISPEAAALTQGTGASGLGRRLLVAAGRADRTWAAQHLRLRLFDRHAPPGAARLHQENFDEVAYASARMLHGWDVPAWVEGRPFVDAAYTCICPAVELAELGYGEVIAVATEPAPLWRDLFSHEPLPDQHGRTPIRLIAPAYNPRELGVDFASAGEDGLLTVYQHGEAQGRAFLATLG
jgi:hypothetical protein